MSSSRTESTRYVYICHFLSVYICLVFICTSMLESCIYELMIVTSLAGNIFAIPQSHSQPFFIPGFFVQASGNSLIAFSQRLLKSLLFYSSCYSSFLRRKAVSTINKDLNRKIVKLTQIAFRHAQTSFQ